MGTGVETNLIGLAGALAAAMGRPHLQPEFLAERTVSPVRRRLADVSAARGHLGFQAEIPLEQGLRDLVDWWRAERREAAASSALLPSA